MATRRQWHLSALSAIVGAALLAACGGGGDDKELNVSKVVSFGDSLSDLGTYTPATSITRAPGRRPSSAASSRPTRHTGYTRRRATPTMPTSGSSGSRRRSVSPITQAEARLRHHARALPGSGQPAWRRAAPATAKAARASPTPMAWKTQQGALTDPLQSTQVAAHLARFGGFGGTTSSSPGPAATTSWCRCRRSSASGRSRRPLQWPTCRPPAPNWPRWSRTRSWPRARRAWLS